MSVSSIMNKYLIETSVKMACPQIILLADDIRQLEDEREISQGIADLELLVKQAERDREFRNVFLDWAEEGGTVVLRDLFDFDGLEGGLSYWNDLNAANRIDRLDSAALHIRDHMDDLERMGDICKLAVENGASYTMIADGESVDLAFEYISQIEEHLSMADLRRYDMAMTYRPEVESVLAFPA